MVLSDDIRTEESSLLPDFRRGESSGRSLERDEMEKTTHNDPVAKMEDIHRLFGSTRILRNSIINSSQAGSNETRRSLGSHKPGREPRRSSIIAAYIAERKRAVLFLDKVKSTWFEDFRSLAEGTIPQSVVLSLIIGTVCGIACWVYYSILTFLLEFIWKTVPEKFIKGNWEVHNYWLYIPLTSAIFCTLVGLTVVFMGEPGDLPYTISRVHNHAFIPIDHVMPMIFASLFSILAGGSLGPEAPLVAICGAAGGFISRRIFRQQHVNVVRKHTLMGMAGALSAFFGVPLGGSLFALEVCSRFGVEYFEHLIESIFCGEICLVVFRSLSGLNIAPIWDFSGENGRLTYVEPWMVLAGGFIGLIGALIAYIFAIFHSFNMAMFAKLNLLDNSRAVYRAWVGGFFIVLVGVTFPQTMFWGEEEIQIIANMQPVNDLPHIWPPTGFTGYQMDSAWSSFVVGMAKIVAVSFTVAGGLRGGYIFPLMLAGSAFGRALYVFVPGDVPLQVCVLCMAAGVNVAITRTCLASTLILAFLPGEPCAIPPILMASLCSLFATAYVPFIKSQITRSDIDHSLFHHERVVGKYTEKLDDDEEDDHFANEIS